MATHQTCTACSQPAEFCQECTEHSTTVPHCEHELTYPSYCHHCAAIFPSVAACVDTEDMEDENGYRGLTSTDFEVWATDSAHGAPTEELNLIEHWLADWTTPDGTLYPTPAWRA